MNILQLAQIFDTSDFPARWNCGRWTGFHGWTHILADTAIFGAYVAIPVTIGYFIRKRRDVQLPSLWWLFAAFIFACGSVHLVEATIFWYPWYRFSALIKVITAVVSWATVVAIFRHMPALLALPGAVNLNEQLQKEIESSRQMGAALARGEERFRSVVEAAPSAMLIVDEQGQMILVNARTESLFGYPRGALLGQPVEMLVPERLRAAHLGLRAGFHGAPKARAMVARRDLIGLRKDGSEVSIEIGLNPISTPEGTCVLASIIDITERKQVEAQKATILRELEEKNAQMEQFLYMISHDLKSPLITIKSFAGMVEQDLATGHPEMVTQDLERISKAASRMNLLLEELLKLSQVGVVVNTHEEVSFTELAEEARELLAGRLLNGGVALEIQSEMPTILVDRQRMIQVLQNLMDNAARFMGDQSKPRIEVGTDLHGELPRFFVRDNGMGLDPRHREKIFGLFDKLDPKSEGTGVGLALVKQIIEMHGGKIWVESEGAGRGSTFWFTLDNGKTPAQHG
jgi:PAS domain S-box-containing protein